MGSVLLHLPRIFTKHLSQPFDPRIYKNGRVFIGRLFDPELPEESDSKNLLFIAGISDILLIIAAFTQTFGIELIILNLIAQIVFDAGFPLLIFFISEVYPTVVRHYALGFFMSYGSLIVLITKPVFDLFELLDFLHHYMFGGNRCYE